jgi:hypothetical protein
VIGIQKTQAVRQVAALQVFPHIPRLP